MECDRACGEEEVISVADMHRRLLKQVGHVGDRHCSREHLCAAQFAYAQVFDNHLYPLNAKIFT